MTADEYAQLVLKARDDLFAAIRAALPAECEMEKRFIQAGTQSETDWAASLVNKDTDGVRIFILLIQKLDSANEEKTAGGRMFKPSMRLSFELFHDHLQGKDGDNTQTVFESDAIKLQYAIETNKNLPPKAYIDSYEINLGAFASKVRSMHYGRGEIVINFRDIRYDI
jgi:hypothetical protein